MCGASVMKDEIRMKFSKEGMAERLRKGEDFELSEKLEMS